MRKSGQSGWLLIFGAGLALALVLAAAQARGSASPTQPASSGKQLPTSPSYSVYNKHPTPSPYITSCPISRLPQPGVIHEAVPDSDPTYVFQSAAIGVSGGQPYMIAAGYIRSKPTQGVISVQPISLDPCKDFVSHQGQPTTQAGVAIAVWSAPSQGGAITLTDVRGDTIGYTTADGKSGHFDYVTKVFLP